MQIMVLPHSWPQNNDNLINQGHFSPNRELHKGVEFLPGEFGVREALEVNNQDLWQQPQVQLLCGQLVLFAGGAIPRQKEQCVRMAERTTK